MKKEEDVATQFLRVDEIAKSIAGLGDMIEENIVVQNIMRTLATKFNLNVSVLKDRSDLDNPTKDELYGILTAYKMRIEPENISKK